MFPIWSSAFAKRRWEADKFEMRLQIRAVAPVPFVCWFICSRCNSTFCCASLSASRSRWWYGVTLYKRFNRSGYLRKKNNKSDEMFKKRSVITMPSICYHQLWFFARAYFVTLWTGTTKNDLKFIRLKRVFSIWETRKNIRSSSFSFSSWFNNKDAVPWRTQYASKARSIGEESMKSLPMFTVVKSF